MASKTYLKLVAYDADLREKYGPVLCGVDEAGRGAWSGPIAAGAVILPPTACIVGMNDSKQIKDPARREALAELVKSVALGWSVQMIGPEEIDSKGIQWANAEVMRRAAEEAAQRAGLRVDLYVIDQSPCKSLHPHLMLAKADGTSQCVASGAILAKTTRDAHMAALGEKYPEYNLAGNDGYVRPEHVDAVNKYGLVQGLHRFTWNVEGMIKPKPTTYDLDLIF